MVAGAAERMQDLVTTALDSSRPARRVLSEPVDLHALVQASVSSFLPTATAGRIRVDVTGASALLIYGDAFRLRQVIDNLLSNAVKYTAAGGSIVVSLDVADDALAELVVADTGSGMAAADVERLFEPYFRGEQAAHGRVPGTGLGLVTVRDIVTAHGGTVDVHSRLGEGTRMRVRLPRRPERNDA